MSDRLHARAVSLRQRLVRGRVGLHPALSGSSCQRPLDLGRGADGQHAVGNLGAGRDQRAGRHHRARPDAGAVEHGRSVADERLLGDGRAVHDRGVADGGDRADRHGVHRRHVDHRAVLDVGAAAHDDGREVGAQHRVVPDRRVFLDRHVADEHGGRRNERARMDARRLSLEAEQWHGARPRSILETAAYLIEFPRRRRIHENSEDHGRRDGDTGCASAMVALQQAWNHLRAFPSHRALLVSVEICSAAYFLDDRLESAVAHAIFADGAGALALSTEGPGPRVVAHRTLFRPEHLDAMGFEYPGGRPRVILSKDVRRIGATMLGEMLRVLMDAQGLKREDVRYWVLHSAGRRVLDRARTLLELDDATMRHSRSVLRHYGNMSSATILFVLDEMLRQESPVPGEWGVMIGLGPGFAAEGALLSW